MLKTNRTALVVWAILPLTPMQSLADHPSAAFSSNQAGPLITMPSSTLPAGTWSSGFRIEQLILSPLSDSVLEQAALDDNDIHSTDSLTAAYLSLAYGVTDRLTIGVNIPHVSREGVREGELEHGAPEAHEHDTIKGIGDVTLLGQYQLGKDTSTTTQFSLLLGIQLPTGDDKVEQDGRHIETEFQPGSGTWQPMIGATASRRIGGGSLDANFLYLHTQENSEHSRVGTLLNYNFSWSYRFSSDVEESHSHDEHMHLTWDAIVELNGELRGKNEGHGGEEAHSGGNLVYLSPGVRLTLADTLNFSASIGLPILDDTNGIQPDVDYRTNIGIGLSF